MTINIEKIFERLPYPAQRLALNYYALRIHSEKYGRGFKKDLEFLRSSQWYSEEEIYEYQNLQFLRLIKHAYSNIEYYNELFKSLKLRVSDFKSLDDIHKIPILTKESVQKNISKLIWHEAGRLQFGGTSGTTGTPLKVAWDAKTVSMTNAVDWRQKEWGGVAYGERMALLLGRVVVNPGRRTPPFWNIDHIHNQMWMSSFHLSDNNLGSYVRAIKRYRPSSIEGYPSNLKVLARYIKERDISLDLQAVFSSSEPLMDDDRKEIESAFGCKLYDFYGLAERVIFATECGVSKGKHLNFEYGITEIVDENEKAVEQGRAGFLVGTSLTNYGMPLIRYKTSDISRILGADCSCGRRMKKIENIYTKLESSIITPSGCVVSPSALTHPFKKAEGIRMSQIIQTDIDRIVVKIVPDNRFGKIEMEKLVEGIESRLKGEVHVSISLVDAISRTRAGKYRWVVSRLTDKDYSVKKLKV